MDDTNPIIEERRAKLTALRAKGVAFPNDFVREDHAAFFGWLSHSRGWD